jgi:phosphopentomutase
MDRRLKRVFVIVLDSMGMGAMADAERFGDEGVLRSAKQISHT